MREYPTDEELELFIQRLEQQELYAPKHMKEQILGQAFPKQTVEALPASGRGAGRVSLFTYRLKIIAGMAAALMMLMLLPGIIGSGRYEENRILKNRGDLSAKEWEMEEREGVNVNYMLNESMRKANQKLNLWFDRMNDLQFDSLFKEDNGGRRNEN